ncbi:MAG: DUF4417 domain-containing protein [Thermoguttaceae bacterium]|nr:DUF4417 domain-containing protein [Thermoguttaceae bacterium]
MRKKAIIDDGCYPELVRGAQFDGIFEIPIIRRPEYFFVPETIVPFFERNKLVSRKVAVGFNEMDVNFADVLRNPQKYVEDFGRFGAIISPDCSLYVRASRSVQIINTYRNRTIGSFFQRHGLYVIPQIRRGSSATYTTEVFPERVAFLGAEKHSIVAIGTYGCIQSREEKRTFKSGLHAMLETLEPEVVLVYGSMPRAVFEDYRDATRFIQFDDWTTRQHGGK